MSGGGAQPLTALAASLSERALGQMEADGLALASELAERVQAALQQIALTQLLELGGLDASEARGIGKARLAVLASAGQSGLVTAGVGALQGLLAASIEGLEVWGTVTEA